MAHDVPRALPACVEAARLAAAYAPAEALRHLERALEMWPSVPDAEERCGVDVVEVLHRAGLPRTEPARSSARSRCSTRRSASWRRPRNRSGARC